MDICFSANLHFFPFYGISSLSEELFIYASSGLRHKNIHKSLAWLDFSALDYPVGLFDLIHTNVSCFVSIRQFRSVQIEYKPPLVFSFKSRHKNDTNLIWSDPPALSIKWLVIWLITLNRNSF